MTGGGGEDARRTDDPTALRDVARAVADAAGRAILPHFRTPLKVDSKGRGFDPVTVADRAAEAAMRAVLAARRPDDAVLGEEAAATPGTTGLTWILDPIDGTRAFISGAPTWGVLIGLREGDRIVLGVIDQPFTDERFEGGPSGAVWTRGGERRRLRVRGTAALADATILTTFPEVGTPDQGAAFARLAARCRLTRYGLDCYAYALLAAGHVDLVVEAGLQPYDVAGPIGVVEAAGGVVSSWDGRSPIDGGTMVAAATPALLEAALDVLGAG